MGSILFNPLLLFHHHLHPLSIQVVLLLFLLRLCFGIKDLGTLVPRFCILPYLMYTLLTFLLLVIFFSQYVSCISAKMHKSSFPKHVSSTIFPLELVHSDVWGPTPIVSVLEHRFYLIFADDFTRFAWLFLLKQKSNVFSVFVHFKSLVENQFNTKIKTLRSDGGAEFVNHKFKAFCLDNGISHQLSCPYTLQQNGVAKRKHRYIVETG